MREALTPTEWRRAARLFGGVGLLHVLGLALLLVVVASRHVAQGNHHGAAFGVGLGLTAYVLGMRHAFDVDHITAIDNTTRKLMSDDERPLSVGFWFSLGHSSVVFGLSAVFAVGVRGLSGSDSTLHHVATVAGPTVSGAFLILIGLLNLAILVGIVRMFRAMRHGQLDEASLEQHLQRRGLMNRILGRATRAVSKPWHMYPLGVLFGLGFDTATEVALLATAGTAATTGLPFYAILCLPILFAAGMSLLDTLDGAFMSVAYGWALARPVRKVFYNLAITALSVAVALGIGTVELLQALSGQLGWRGGFWDWLAALDFNAMGYALVAAFGAVWALAAVIWRVGRIEDRWAAPSEAG